MSPLPSVVLVPVVNVRVMRVRMHNRLVPMPVCVRFAGGIPHGVRVPVVLVVDVQVLVLQRLVNVLVFVALGHVQPTA